MGGQACVFYGAVQFSKDVDFVLSQDVGNLERLRLAIYWEPLRKELEQFRFAERKKRIDSSQND